MKTILSTILMALLLCGGNALASDMACPDPMEPTIESLHHCVMHAAQEGHIDNAGIARSLEVRLLVAMAAEERGKIKVSAMLLRAFIHEVRAQAGKHVNAEHAEHMIHHAEIVLEAL